MRLNTWTRLSILAALATVAVVGCFTLDRSAEENQETTGRQDRGRDPGRHWVNPTPTRDPVTGETTWNYVLKYSDVIITPDGGHLLVQVPMPGPDKGFSAPGLVLTLRSLDSSATTVVFKNLVNVRRINFSPDGSTAYVLGEDGRKLTRISLDTYITTTLATFDESYRVLDVSPDGRFVVASNLPKSDWEEWLNMNGECNPSANMNLCVLSIWDNQAMDTVDVAQENRIRDLDFGPAGALLLTSSTWDDDGIPVASIAFVHGGTGVVEDVVSFPNCADELKLQPGGSLALLAPIRCRELSGGSADPISVIDLDARAFITNLPGFGPVGISPDGTRAVGFTMRDDMLNEWNYTQKEQVGLIVIDLPSLSWNVIEYGAEVPTYLVTGDDGNWIYAHHKTWVCQDLRGGGQHCESATSPLYRFDVATGSRIAVSGSDARLDVFVKSADEKTLYFLTDGKLTRLNVGETTAEELELAFTPELINIRPQGDLIVFGENNKPRFYTAHVAAPAALTPFDVSATEGVVGR